MVIPASSTKLKRFLEDIYGDNEVGQPICASDVRVSAKRTITAKQMPDYRFIEFKNNHSL